MTAAAVMVAATAAYRLAVSALASSGPASSVFARIAALARPWQAVNDAVPAVHTAVLFAHIAGVTIAAGTALAAAGRRWRAPDAGDAAVAAVRGTDRVVVRALLVVVASGLLLALTDVDTYTHARLFWAKMALVAALAANGGAALRSERLCDRAERACVRRRRAHAATSAILWLLTILAGTALADTYR